MDTSLLILEAAKLGLQIYFTNMKVGGKSAEELERVFQEEKAKFIRNDPDNLEDV